MPGNSTVCCISARIQSLTTLWKHSLFGMMRPARSKLCIECERWKLRRGRTYRVAASTKHAQLHAYKLEHRNKYKHIYMYIYKYTYIHTYKQTCANTHTGILTCMHTHKDTYIHTYIHACAGAYHCSTWPYSALRNSTSPNKTYVNNIALKRRPYIHNYITLQYGTLQYIHA